MDILLTINNIIIVLAEGAKFLKSTTQTTLSAIKNGKNICEDVISTYNELKFLLIKENKVEDYTFKGFEKYPDSDNRRESLKEELQNNLSEEFLLNNRLKEKIENLMLSIENANQSIPKKTQETVGIKLTEAKNAYINYKEIIAEYGALGVDASKSTEFRAEGETLRATGKNEEGK